MKTAICPGSFDPITLGHLNIIRRASQIFDEVVVCVMYNMTKKSPMFTVEEKVAMVQKAVSRYKNVRVDWSDGLLAEYVRQYENPVIVKGLRAASDFEYEFMMALTNKKMNSRVETIFLAADEKYTYLSSSTVKEIARYGGDISGFVPAEVLSDAQERFNMGRNS